MRTAPTGRKAHAHPIWPDFARIERGGVGWGEERREEGGVGGGGGGRGGGARDRGQGPITRGWLVACSTGLRGAERVFRLGSVHRGGAGRGGSLA